MKRSWLAISLLALSTAASAGTVSFQSGEHDGFTRLVATLPTADTEWRLTRSGRTYTLAVEGDDLRFATDKVFSRIARTRLQSISTDTDSGIVRFNLACDCEIESARFNTRHVIFDIRPAKEPSSVIPENFALKLPAITDEEPSLSKWARATPASGLPTSAPKPALSEEIVISDPTQDFDIYVRNKEKVSRIAQQVINQINRAEEQNLLTRANIAAAPPERTNASQQPSWQHPQTTTPAQAPQSASTNVSTYNAVDIAAQEIAAVLAGRAGISACIQDSRLDIESWGGTGNFATELGLLRSELVGEFDLTNSASMTALAQFYISRTFGAEALQILQRIPENERDPVLSAMAHLVDSGSAGPTNPFMDQGHCPSDVAFWAVLSGQKLTGKSAVDSALETFSGLPLTLREHLAPYLSNRFVEVGQIEAAELVLNAIERGNPSQGPEFAMAQAAIHAEKGEDEAAIETLEQLTTENTAMTPAAVVELIASHVAQDTVVPDDLVALVGALAVEHKIGQMGLDLRHAHAQARMMSGDFTTAFAIVVDIDRFDGDFSAARTRSEITRRLLENGEDFDILTHALTQGLTEPEQLELATAVALAQRMYVLGFLDQTKRLLQALRIEEVTPEMHILKAKVALKEDLPRRAEAELLSVNGPEADSLRAKARSMAGDHMAAAEILQSLGDAERAAFEAWLGGDLSGLSALDMEVYQRIETMLAEADIPSLSENTAAGVLDRNRDLLAGSEAARGTLTELLSLHKISGPSS